MANGSLAHERGMVWVGAVMGLEESLERLLGEAPPLLDRLTAAERALAVDQIVQVAIDTQAARCLGYRGFAKLARGGTAPEQALMKLFASEARQRLALGGRRAPGRRRRSRSGSVALDGHLAIDEPQGTWLEQYFISLRQHHLGGRLGDPAQHHRRAGARPPPWLTTHRRAAASSGPATTNPGLVTDDRRWTWAEVVQESCTRAAQLDDLGLSGRHVGVLLDNVPEYVFLLGGAALSGRVVVGINPTRRGEELARDIRHTDCAVVLTDAAHAPLLEGLDLDVPVHLVDGRGWTSRLDGAPRRAAPRHHARRRTRSTC